MSSNNNQLDNLKSSILRYLNFWPHFITSILLALIITFIFIRYSDRVYSTSGKILIIDDAQDSEMALPTAMTIFNRSLINLENEIEVLRSHRLTKSVLDSLKLNVEFHTVGSINSSLKHSSEWLESTDFKINFQDNFLDQSEIIEYIFEFSSDEVHISRYIDSDFTEKYSFNYNQQISLIGQFDFSFDLEKKSKLIDREYKMKILPKEYTLDRLRKSISVSQVGRESDILEINIESKNQLIAESIINVLVYLFDKDGIIDRQQVFKSTIDFVNSRYKDLEEELNLIETEKEIFKKNNKLVDIESDAVINNNQIIAYESQLFQVNTQLDLVKLLEESLEEKNLDFIPINIGIENEELNNIINEYNKVISQINKYDKIVGSNNRLLKSLNFDANNLFQGIQNSISNYKLFLSKNLDNLLLEEIKYTGNVSKLPKEEKILRSIEREQNIKEALFLLLLQKKEEASINFAVTKPSIKIIDDALTNFYAIYPNKIRFYAVSLVLGFLIPFIILYAIFFFDNKIHTRDQIKKILSDIPIIGEIPFVQDSEKNNLVQKNSRTTIAESFRMISSNLNFFFISEKQKKSKVILVTSSIKGEGKTIVSANLAKTLSFKHNKALLIGADLRNPQIHKLLNEEKSVLGLSDYLSDNSVDLKKLIYKNENLDILLSGTIPPNPTDLLSSDDFKLLLDKFRLEYDCIIIDSAPCLLVSDTFEISKFVDKTIYVVRSSFSQMELLTFINESRNEEKIKNVSLVLNSVGSSRSYGYKYGYQYGYRYNYKYNYGYSYGYREDE